MNRITHILSVMIIAFFMISLFFQIFFFQDKPIIPDYFISIVSIIIGFYFAKSPLFQ